MTSRSRPPIVPVVSLLAAGALTAAGALLGPVVRGVPSALGAPGRRIRRRVARASRTPGGAVGELHDGRRFRNRQPSSTVAPSDVPGLVRALRQRGPVGAPTGEVPLVTATGVLAPTAGPDLLAARWLGHASVLLEIDGARVLFDPVVQERVSPSASVGPRRLHPAPAPLPALVAELGDLDAVVISHDHYDHLEQSTVVELARATRCRFVVPLGIGAHLRRWRIPEDRIDELDWDGATEIAGLRISCVEARHFSGRGLRRDQTLWSSWVVAGPSHRVFFGGDTGYHPAFARTGALLGPFDLTVLPIGAYHPAWRDIHLDPEEAARAHGDLGGTALLPIHWATFDLALHPWDEPIERLLRAVDGAPETGRGPVVVGTPRPGERWVIGEQVPTDRWWRPIAPSTPRRAREDGRRPSRDDLPSR